MNKEFEVICIKDIEFENQFRENHSFRKGQIYLAKEVKFDPEEKLDENYIVVKAIIHEVSIGLFYGETAFWIKNPHRKWNNFSEYFITLADWRDLQIDKILND